MYLHEHLQSQLMQAPGQFSHLCCLLMQGVHLDSQLLLSLDTSHVAHSVLKLPPYASMLPMPCLLLAALLVQILEASQQPVSDDMLPAMPC